MYLWPFIANNQRNRIFGTTNGVAREYGEYLHRYKLEKYMCKVFAMIRVNVFSTCEERLLLIVHVYLAHL